MIGRLGLGGLGALTDEGITYDHIVWPGGVVVRARKGDVAVGEVALHVVSSARLQPRGVVARRWGETKVLSVVSASVMPVYQRQGVGLAMYRRAVEVAWAEHSAVVVSHACVHRGKTSNAALRVWRALGRHYDVVALGDCKAVLGARRDR